ncbi:MAG: CheB methylesterase domain-containing protein, partial [Myxococcota bacterium]
VPIALVQHMPPVFTRMFASRLQGASGLDVVEATEGVALRAGRVVLAPGDHHLVLDDRAGDLVGRLDRGPQVNSCRPSADVLFRSAVEVSGGVLGVVMTGLGRDGCDGAAAIVRAGGRVIAQDRESSVAWGMPGAVVEAGLASRVVRLEELGASIGAAVGCRGVAPC